MLINDQYDMITPEEKFYLEEYKTFYTSMGQIFKMSLIENQMFHEIEKKLPAFFLEISQNLRERDRCIDSYLMCLGLQRKKGRRDSFLRGISDSEYIIKYFDSDLSKYIDFYTNYQQFLLMYANFEGNF